MAKAIVLRKKEAIKEAMVREEGLIFWTDGSRLDNGKVGSAVVWKEGEEWKEERSYLGKKKEVFEAEVYAIMRAMRKCDRNRQQRKSRQNHHFLGLNHSYQKGPRHRTWTWSSNGNNVRQSQQQVSGHGSPGGVQVGPIARRS